MIEINRSTTWKQLIGDLSLDQYETTQLTESLNKANIDSSSLISETWYWVVSAYFIVFPGVFGPTSNLLFEIFTKLKLGMVFQDGIELSVN